MNSSPRVDAPNHQTVEQPVATDVVYFDGRYVAKAEVRVSPDDRGFLLGDGRVGGMAIWALVNFQAWWRRWGQ